MPSTVFQCELQLKLELTIHILRNTSSLWLKSRLKYSCMSYMINLILNKLKFPKKIFFSLTIHYEHRHRACNIFARTYYELWLQEENVGQEIMIEDLTVSI